MDPSFYTLWAINAPLDERRLCGQLDSMRAFGFDGTVFHPRFYPGKPAYLSDEYMAIVSKVILYAKSIGMDFWIYDEDGWPSGTAGGELLRLHPDVRQQRADLVTGNSNSVDVLATFFHAGKRWSLRRRHGAGVDYFSPDLSRHFLAMTHERYRTALTPAAFEHVAAFFCDEPEFGLGHAYDSLSPNGSIPWTPRLPELYQQRYGETLTDTIPKLFFPLEGYQSARVQFWELLTDIFCDSFISPIDTWCKAHGKRLAAHLKGEEHPLFQVPTHGSAQQIFRRLSMPGIDALARDPSNDFFPRQLVSSAHQFGDGRSMAECFGGAGWGAEPEDLRRYLLWLGGHGITDYVLHLWQYRLNSDAIRDWPASIPNHIGWRDAFPELLKHVKQEMIDAAERARVGHADTLLISPHRGVMQVFQPDELLKMNVHDAGTYSQTPAAAINDRFMGSIVDLQRQSVAYHVADERTFESGSLSQNGFQVGRHLYRSVLLSDDCALTLQGKSLLTRVKAAGTSDSPAISRFPPIRKLPGRQVTALPVVWNISVPRNELLLEPALTSTAEDYRATFLCGAGVPDLTLVFADEVSQVSLNGVVLATRTTDEGSFADIPASKILTGGNNLTFVLKMLPRHPQSRPFVWVRGMFGLQADSGFNNGPAGTVKLTGPFTIVAPRSNLFSDITNDGYPFVRDPVTAETKFETGEHFSRLALAGLAAAAARVCIDNLDRDFIWGPEWSLTLEQPLTLGCHTLVLISYPSAFNTFGPHHHRDGDLHIVSPLQFEGRKNFADQPDAPENTHLPCWHVKPLYLPKLLTFGDR